MSRCRSASCSSCATGLLICAAARFIAGCGSTGSSALPAASGIGGLSSYVGASICQRCHTDVHALWSASSHGKALDTLRASGDDNNPDCLICHTTGFRAGGFVSAKLTPGLGNVQCEACHGTGAKHAGTRNPADIKRVPGTTVCGICHTGPAQPEHDEWQQSAHAQALAAVRSDANASDACLQCHATDYMQVVRMNEVRALNGFQPLPLPSLTAGGPGGVVVESVGCTSCHAPHGSTNMAQLRFGVFATCGKCHTDPQPTPGQPAHAPQMNMLNANGGRQLTSDPAQTSVALVGPVAIHATIESLGGCAKCHTSVARVSAPTVDNPSQTGHRFTVSFDNCLPCHAASDAAGLVANRKATTIGRLSGLRARAAAVANWVMTKHARDELDAAILNLDLIEQDRSFGCHNTGYTDALFNAAEALLNAVEHPS